jgi:hypothetical protein
MSKVAIIHPVMFVPIGGSATDKGTRTLGWNLPQKGWFHSVIDQRIEGWATEFKRRGLRFRIMLHNPWGHDGNYPMDFDQRIEAAETGKLDLMIQTFPAWLESRLRPLVGDSGELIIYLGALDVDPDFVDRDHDPKAYRERVAASLVDVPRWASLAFDHSSEVMPDSIEWSVMLGEQAAGRRIYCEPRPKVGSAVVGLPVVSDAALWWRTSPDDFKDARHMASQSVMGGAEILTLIVGGSDQSRRAMVQRSVNAGLTPLFGYGDLAWALDIKREAK